MTNEQYGFEGETKDDPVGPDLRQGDIFEWITEQGDGFGDHGVVVTADCDIAREKHRGILSYVPVVSSPAYLSKFYLPKALAKVLEKEQEVFLSTTRSHQRALPDFTQPISSQALIDWLETAGIAAVMDGLAITDQAGREAFEAHSLRIRQAQQAISSGRFEELWNALISCRSKGNRSDAAEKSLLSDAENVLSNLPGDAFFIGRIGKGLETGYVVYLRHLREIRDSEIATSVPDLRKAGIRARRIARLRSPYVYRLTQQLGDVFASIGLPEEYERRRSDLARSLRTTHSAQTED